MTLVCLLEEPSAEEMLKAILPKILNENINVKYIVFKGKQDLENNVIRKIKNWQTPDSCFLIMRDKDSGDCIRIKNDIKEKVKQTGKSDCTCIRIACHELESFYLGDLEAVCAGLDVTIKAGQESRKYRQPDTLANAAEELIKITQKKYSKLKGSRSIAPYLKLDGSNKSHSFNVLLDGVKIITNKKQSAEQV